MNEAFTIPISLSYKQFIREIDKHFLGLTFIIYLKNNYFNQN